MGRKLLTIALLVCFYASFGQYSMPTYQFGKVLPQASLLNPSVLTDYKVEVSLPGLSSTFVDFNSTLSFRDFTVVENGNLRLDLNSIPDELNRDFRSEIQGDIQLLHVGFKAAEGYISFDVRQRMENRVIVPKELFQWAIWGPADPRVGGSIDFDDLRVQGMNYMEYSAAYARMVVPGLQVGARVKYIRGQAGINGSQSGSLLITQDSVAIQLTNFEYSIGGIPDIENFDSIDLSTVLGTSSGFGIDLGVTYEFNQKVRLSASLLDLGTINWKNNVTTYAADDLSYTFTGFEVTDLINNNDVFQQELDELENLVNIEEQSPRAFQTGLNPKFIAGLSYQVTDFYSVGSTVYTAWNQGKIDPSLSIHQTLNAGKFLHFLTGITYRNGKISNLSGGLVLKPGPVQFYIISDRINSFYYPARASSVNLRIGLNLVFGKRALLTD